MFAAGSGPLGGSVAQASGTPHWLHYVGTPDIDATVQAAKSRGGSVTKEITAIPNGGKYAVLADPQGAAIAVYQLRQDAGKESPPKRGEFSWHELATSDWRAAIDFYSAVFGWEKMAEHDMGPEMGKYVLFGSNGVQRGGMFNKPARDARRPGLARLRPRQGRERRRQEGQGARAARWSTGRWKCRAATGSRSSSIRTARCSRCMRWRPT